MDEFIIAGVATIVGAAAKAGWDWLFEQRKAHASLALTKHVEFLDRQLSEFYWPLYIRLETDNTVWTRILDVAEEDDLKRRVAQAIERTVILPNHEEITRIIETRMHLAQAGPELAQALLQYINHVTLHRALRDAGDEQKFPLDFGVPWPEDLFPLIKERTETLQSAYDLMIQERNLLSGFRLPARKARASA